MLKIKGLISILCLFICFASFAQKPKQLSSSEIYAGLEKLNFLGSALYIAAHPDDENTRMISHLSNGLKARTAYLSLTRGDGGQNLIGTEIQELLGVLRTQELLMARSVDGGEQFFSRAIDFGYSKHPDETLEIWNKDEVLSDVVRVIRQYKPDIIINRFDHRSPGKTHGHHTSSAMLSVEAFDLVNDASKYPDHLEQTEVWQPTRLFFNTSWWFYGGRDEFAKADKSNLLSVDVGSYYDMLGKSNNEIAAEARSKHRCQGFGSAGTRGSYTEYLELLKGEMPENKADIFEGINTSWSRLEGGEKVGELLQNILTKFDFKAPQKSVPNLVGLYKNIEKLPDSHWRTIKLKEAKELLAACAGLYIEASADAHRVTHGDSVEIKIEAINRSPVEMNLSSYSLGSISNLTMVGKPLNENEPLELYRDIKISNKQAQTEHYWLKAPSTLGMFAVDDEANIGKPETPRSYTVNFDLEIMGASIEFERELVYRYTDPSVGLIYRPFEIIDPIFVSIAEDAFIFPDDASKQIEVTVTAARKDVAGTVKLKIPNGWTSNPVSYEFDIANKDGFQKLNFELTPPKKQSTGYISPIASYNGKDYSNELVEINYEHIPFQSVSKSEKAKVAKIDIQKKGEKVAYIMGAGDKVPECLRYIGYQVDEIDVSQAEVEYLKNYDALVLGVRALNTIENIGVYRDNMMEYVNQGGTMIVQYNTSRRVKAKDFPPYPITLSRFRVSQEDAEVRIVNPDHPLMNEPNKITEADFEDWIQERGLYFAGEWDKNYETILSSNDPGEDPGEGGLLVSKYGEGHFIYSSYSWFRELPAGVPGAYRIFTNMISLGN